MLLAISLEYIHYCPGRNDIDEIGAEILHLYNISSKSLLLPELKYADFITNFTGIPWVLTG